jgi:hypothetical protein
MTWAPTQFPSLIKVLFIIFSLVSFSTEGSSMSLLAKPQDVVLASPLEGLLTYEGKPASGVKIVRKLRWYDGEESTEDFVVTDTNGHFTLPVIRKTVKISGLVHFVAVQQIYAVFNGEDIDLWTMGYSGKTEYGELGGKPVNFRCELTDEEQRVSPNNKSIYTRCRWDELRPVEEQK